ncbi:MAG: hypothetical protein WD669_10755 [Pirellulales bacterium]
MQVSPRTTVRKALIEKTLCDEFSGGPVLLEELRWRVFTKQLEPGFTELTDAKRKSFARTIREHMPQLQIQRFRVRELASGLITRAALYRIQSRAIIQHFIATSRNSVVITIGFPDHYGYQRGEFGDRLWNERRQHYRKKLPRVTVGCFFLEDVVSDESWPINLVDRATAKVVIPKSHKIVVIRDSSPQRALDLRPLTRVPWKIYHINNRLDGGGKWSLVELEPFDVIPFSRKRS